MSTHQPKHQETQTQGKAQQPAVWFMAIPVTSTSVSLFLK